MARSVLSDLMCLAHEGTPYGYLTDKMGALTEDYMAARCVLSPRKFRSAVEELKQAQRVHSDGDLLFIKRMVDDEDLRLRKVAGGFKGGNPELQKKVNQEVNQEVNGHTHERARADSGSGSVSGFDSRKELPSAKNGNAPSERFPEWWMSIWSPVRGTNHLGNAEQVFPRVVTVEMEIDCMECTASYVQSIEPSKGYNPENFLIDQARDKFKARFPPKANKKLSFEEGVERTISGRLSRGEPPW